jgi:D-sedoheptulose 7-phosphate isomerase
MNASAFHIAHQEHLQVFSALEALAPQIEQIADALAASLQAGRKIMWCGNGGSAADAQHLAAELTGRFVNNRIPLAGLALATDASALTCIGNDFGFDAVFERQVMALGQGGDCLIAISTSGQSPNVVRAVEAARAKGILTVGLTGRDGGRLAGLCDHCLVVPSATTARIQEAHIFIGHLWCTLIERALGVGQ